MTDESPDTNARRPQPTPPEGGAPPPAADDPDAALRRLESMGTAPAQPPAEPAALPPRPAVDPFDEPPARPQRPLGSSKKALKATPRPAGSRTSRTVARIAAPVVFLVAVVALVGIVVNSGVLDEPKTPTVTPTATATKGGDGGAKVVTKKYVVKSGDSLSSIAVRFDTTTAVLRELNPDLDTNTLMIGARIIVPAQ